MNKEKLSCHESLLALCNGLHGWLLDFVSKTQRIAVTVETIPVFERPVFAARPILCASAVATE